eukprot:30831-Pelagococcus_subviridis.AAC.6
MCSTTSTTLFILFRLDRAYSPSYPRRALFERQPHARRHLPRVRDHHRSPDVPLRARLELLRERAPRRRRRRRRDDARRLQGRSIRANVGVELKGVRWS